MGGGAAKAGREWQGFLSSPGPMPASLARGTSEGSLRVAGVVYIIRLPLRLPTMGGIMLSTSQSSLR